MRHQYACGEQHRDTDHGKGDSVVDLAEALNLVVALGVLVAKLIARKAKDDKVIAIAMLFAHFLVQSLEALELGRKGAFRSRIDNEHDFVGVLGQRKWLEFLCPG